MQSSISKWQLSGCMPGCTGERSVPMTSAEGKRSAMSVAQIPVPVPMSRIRVGLVTGARKSWSRRVRMQRWCL